MDSASELFGDARLLEAIGRGRSSPLKESIAAVVDELERWRDAASAQDDFSIVAVEIASGPGKLCVDPRPESYEITRTQ